MAQKICSVIFVPRFILLLFLYLFPSSTHRVTLFMLCRIVIYCHILSHIFALSANICDAYICWLVNWGRFGWCIDEAVTDCSMRSNRRRSRSYIGTRMTRPCYGRWPPEDNEAAREPPNLAAVRPPNIRPRLHTKTPTRVRPPCAALNRYFIDDTRRPPLPFFSHSRCPN